MKPTTTPPKQLIGPTVSLRGVHSVLALAFCLTVTSGCAGLIENYGSDLRCPDTIQAKISEATPTVRVSYTEPSTTVEGTPLTDLSKTSIYYDLGKGRVLAKNVPATQATGGGSVSETIVIPIHKKEEQSVKICVTATDQLGNESTMTP